MSFSWHRATAHLALLAVAPTQRRNGIGGALIDWLVVVARRGGIERVTLEVRSGSRDAQRFYRQRGFAETGRVAGYYDGREDAVRMVVALGNGV